MSVNIFRQPDNHEKQIFCGKYVGTSTSQIQYKMIDSIGYESNWNYDKIKVYVYTLLKYETELSCVIIVINFDEFRNGSNDHLNHLLKVIQTLEIDNNNHSFYTLYKGDSKCARL